MLPLLVACLVSSVVGQIDPSVLEDIFGTPPPRATTTGNPNVATTPRLEDITVVPTSSPTNLVDANGDACQCVPYYLCDNELNAVDANNASVTGFGTLDIRFREDDCQESIERCCKKPKRPDEVPEPTPNPTRIKGCGYRNPNGVDFTITGGTGQEAQFGEFPWVVAIIASNGTYSGVGVLIHPQVIMTGAHIANKFAPGNVKIRAGEWDTQTIKERLKYQERQVNEIYTHKDFYPKSLKNNIALFLLDEPLQPSEHINVICLPSLGEQFDRYKGCVANGWGRDAFGKQGRYAVILKKVEMDMVPHNRCNQLLKRTRLGNSFKLHDSFVCAGGEEGKDTCTGDGGAPLACPIGQDRYKLTGLVAWGIGCGQKDVPAVYTAVPRFRQWVDDKMAAWGLDTSGYNV